ncbi:MULTISPECIES: transporter substrate-binding domain-containing protein [Petrimonas]|nr:MULTISPECIES: transporter substrate-binding domain-containing protein [Petrimonas]MDD3560678.1 transporter substrate-binding domain-containing protein [Petrimonas mucosa]HHT30129.1 transporter substrate-binding domain-containing protein [Petrimonas mucosa]
MKTKRMLIVYSILLGIVLALMVMLYSLSRKSAVLPRDYPEIVESGELNIVTSYDPIGYHVSGDTIAGFQYELIKILERDWGLKINIFLENGLDKSLEGLKQGKYDVVARNIPVNTELRQQFGFTRSINLNKQVLVQRKAEFNNGVAPIRQHLDLAKRTIHVHRNSPVILRLQNLSHEIGDTIFVEQNDLYETEQLVMMVAGGDIDFTVCDEIAARELAERMVEIDVETDISFTQLESWAVRKESPILLDSLDSWLSRYRRR